MLKKNPMKIYAVPSGSCIIGRKKNEILDAYLGTCVGVAICDRDADVGGLMHILLPEPIGTAIHGRLENYARTGLPVFIRALQKNGAHSENMEATIAGGALVGPLTKSDMDLDIGGRSVEIIERILKEEGIAVHKKETGGFFSCKLSLKLRTWETQIEPIGVPLRSEDDVFERPTLESLHSTVDSVRPIPQIALKIIRMIHDGVHNMDELARELKQDQVISAKVIRLCNSAFFNFKTGIDSIDRALVILGEIRLLRMVVSATLEDFFLQNVGGYSLCKGGLFNHAIGTAMICEQLASINGMIPADIAYTAGLMHDIGKVVLDQYVSSAFPFFYRKTQVENVSLIDVEQDAFGVTHQEVGGILAERWSFPKSLSDVIQHHHIPEKASDSSELTHLVYLADLLMSRFIVGQELERLDTDFLKPRMEKIGLTVDQFPMMVERIPSQLFGFK